MSATGMRVRLINPHGEEQVEDLFADSSWSARQYRAALVRQRPGIHILDVTPITRELEIPHAEAPAWWWVTLCVPGRPCTRVRVQGGWAEVRRMAIMGAEPGARLISCRPAEDPEEGFR
jgi:hypothetical protein